MERMQPSIPIIDRQLNNVHMVQDDSLRLCTVDLGVLRGGLEGRAVDEVVGDGHGEGREDGGDDGGLVGTVVRAGVSIEMSVEGEAGLTCC